MFRPRAFGAAASLAICLILEGRPPEGDDASDETRTVSFERDIAPILERCHPCHFPGGKKYDDLPFDDPETIFVLREKLFTRIKDEKDRSVIRAFLSEPDKKKRSD